MALVSISPANGAVVAATTRTITFTISGGVIHNYGTPNPHPRAIVRIGINAPNISDAATYAYLSSPDGPIMSGNGWEVTSLTTPDAGVSWVFVVEKEGDDLEPGDIVYLNISHASTFYTPSFSVLPAKPYLSLSNIVADSSVPADFPLEIVFTKDSGAELDLSTFHAEFTYGLEDDDVTYIAIEGGEFVNGWTGSILLAEDGMNLYVTINPPEGGWPIGDYFAFPFYDQTDTSFTLADTDGNESTTNLDDEIPNLYWHSLAAIFDQPVDTQSHCELAKDRLAAEFQKPRIQAELCLWTDKLQEVEQMFANLQYYRNDVDIVAGDHLDRIGALVGWERHGLNDPEYRQFLKARALIVNSNGTPDEMITILNTMSGNQYPVTYTEGWELDPPVPAYTFMHILVPEGRPELGELYAKLLKQVSSAGVGFVLHYEQEDVPAFRFGVAWEDMVGSPWAHASQGFSGYTRIV